MIYTVTEKRDAVANYRVMRSAGLTDSAIAEKLGYPRSTLLSWVVDGVDGSKRGRPRGDWAKTVRREIDEAFDERGITRRGGSDD